MRSKKFQERRGSPRIKLPPMLTSVVATSTTSPQGQTFHGHAYDISVSGVRIELDHPLDLGQTVGLHVDMPWNGRHIRATADVVWVSDPEDDPGPRRMALQFRSVEHEMSAAALDSLMPVTAARAAA